MQFQREVLDAIRRILRALRESSRVAETELGLSGAQLLILQFLKSADSLSVNELAERTQTHQSSVSVIAARLADAGWVKRQPNPNDGRRVDISLTASGAKLLSRKAPPLAQEKIFSALAEMPASRREQLATLLTELVERAGFADQPATLFFEDEKETKK